MAQVEIAKFKLTGWRAVIAGVVVVGAVIVRGLVASSTVHAEALPELKRQLLGEYTSQNLAPLEAAVDRGDRAAMKRQAELLTQLEKIEFISVKSRGTGSKKILRVEIEVDGNEPPDGQSVRYFRAEHSLITGWRIKGRAYAWSYYVKLF